MPRSQVDQLWRVDGNIIQRLKEDWFLQVNNDDDIYRSSIGMIPLTISSAILRHT